MEIIIMAQLSSPGVSVSVIDESFYTVSNAGTIPLIFVASASNKLTGSGTGFAPGTLAKNDGKVYLLTSQKDLVDTFGTPIFKTDTNNNPIHAGEQNEYGLQAAYSFLGVSNRAYVARASVDLSQLNATAVMPSSDPVDGAVWLNTASTRWGVFEWNGYDATYVDGQTFKNVVPLVITELTQVETLGNGSIAPKSSVGLTGSYAIVAVSSLNKLWYKKYATNTAAGNWVEVGSSEWKASRPTVIGSGSAVELDILLDGFILNGVEIALDTVGSTITTFAGLVAAINANTALASDGVTAALINNKLEIYSTGVDITFADTQTLTASKLGVTIAKPYVAPALQISAHTAVPLFKIKDNTDTVSNRPSGSIWIKTTAINNGADFIINTYKTASKSWIPSTVSVYPTGAAALAGLDPTGGGLHIAGSTYYVKSNETQDSPNPLATFTVYRRSGVGATRIESEDISVTNFPGGSGTAGDYSFNLYESVVGSSTLKSRVVSFHINADTSTSAIIDIILSAINTPSTTSNVSAVHVGTSKIAIIHATGGDIEFQDLTNSPISALFSTTTTPNFYEHSNGLWFIASLWTKFTSNKTSSFITPKSTQPTAGPSNGQLWYDSKIEEVDIMAHNGTTWVAYRNYNPGDGLSSTDASGPIVSPTRPLYQKNGDDLVNGDLWIDSSDTDNYPTIYKFNSYTMVWDLVDKTDQSTENGILFADARWDTSGTTDTPATITALLGGLNLPVDERNAANFLDFDAPNPALYPKGMLLWNLRRSGFNVKRLHTNYVNRLTRNTRYNNESMGLYYTSRWVSEAANNEDGSGAFGRIAQRKVVVQSLQALVNANQQIREEERVLNLIAAPGYPELVGELKILNYDRGITAFVLADAPARLTADATSLSNWGNNTNVAVEDNDHGLVSADPYMAFFYPWGYSSDNIGNNIVVPPTYMMLRTIALSDNISYPWFAPAGTSRGVINNATAVGYVDSEGEFKTVALNGGQRDTLASIKVNALTSIAGSGVVNMGQYTRASAASALDRINVARLVVHLRRKFALLARPYLFEPNDDATRKQIKHAAESMLIELMGQRAIYDYIVVCDSSNNTPDRVDRSELWLDVAIEPTKAVEFIYIPLRLKNTGELKGLG
jgi:hypothetical protein